MCLAQQTCNRRRHANKQLSKRSDRVSFGHSRTFHLRVSLHNRRLETIRGLTEKSERSLTNDKRSAFSDDGVGGANQFHEGV
jgi:hypothetical protein